MANFELQIINFAALQVWVIENSMEVVARQMLLLYLALVPQGSMGINGRWHYNQLFILIKARFVVHKPVGFFPSFLIIFREDRSFSGGVWER